MVVATVPRWLLLTALSGALALSELPLVGMQMRCTTRIARRQAQPLAKLSRKAAKRAAAADTRVVPPVEAPREAALDEVAAATLAEPPIEEAVCGESIFPIGSEGWLQHRVSIVLDDRNSAFTSILGEAVKLADDDETGWAAFVAANRDHIDYRLLYRLTAQVLRTQNLGETEAETRLRAVRYQLVKRTQDYDYPMYKEVSQAEGRLGQVLGQYAQGTKPKASAIVMAAGSSSRQIFSFWLVVVSAIAAWETKLRVQSVAEMASARIADLAEILDILEERKPMMEKGMLTPLLAFRTLPNFWEPGADLNQARTLLQSVASDEAEQQLIIRRIGCIHNQLQRHAFQAYQPMILKWSALHDVLTLGSPLSIQAEDIEDAPSDKDAPYSSTLMQMAAEAEKNLDDDFERPLFFRTAGM